MAVTTARRAQTQEKLIDAAVALFAEKGVLGASVEEICERADFTRGAFYSNFADKDELCLALLSRQADRELLATEEAVASLSQGFAQAETMEDVIASAVRVFVAAQPRVTEDLVAHLELRLYAIRNPAIREAFLALNNRLADQIGALLQSAVSRVGVRLTVPIDQAIDLLHAVYAHSGSSALLQGLEADDEFRWQQLVAVLRALVSENQPPDRLNT